jgi:uncharacterized repeat protein (TIGR01451 family)
VAQNPSLNITKDASVPGGTADVAGEVISYTIGVQNTGNQTLTGVTVSDPFISNLTRIADTTGDNDNLLEVGETWAYTASHTVTQAEIDSGNNIVNVATADSNETGPDTDDASIPVKQAPSLNIAKDATVPGGSADVAGEVISYTIGVQNTGNQTLTGVTVSDPFISNLTRIADTTGDNDNLLEVGETWAYTASHTVTQAEIDAGVPIVNTATADSNETGPDTDDASIPVAQNPSLNITKDASVPGNTADVAGEVISYTIGVQNTGNQTLTGVTVSDPFISNLTRIADTTGDNDNLLEVGETWAYTASHTVTQAEIDAGVPIVNTATADSNETGPDTDDASIPVAQNPSLNITKDASVPGNTADVAGEVISYTIGVQNTGNQTLTGVTVSDPFISNLTRVADTTGDNDNLLEVGETWAYTASHTVTQAEIDAGVPIVNTATADSNETGPDTDDASIPVAQNPSLNITKDASVPGNTADVAGEVISYTIGVQNTGNQTLTGVTVSDPFISNLTRIADTTGDNDNLLEVGETWAYTASHTVTQAEIDAGVPIVNTATADSNETGPDTDDASIPVAQNPSLNITKDASVPGNTADVAGEVISYTIGVQNTGNQTLTGVTVSDPFISNLTRVADTTGDNDNLLEVGETWAYTASHTVTQAEIDAGVPIVNTATADSNETGPDTDDASIPVAQNPSLNITKDASVPGNTADVAGEVISYTIGVQNTGNQTLTGVTVSDPFISNLTRIADTTGDNDNLLEVGETWAYTASHTVTQAEIDSGNNIVNVATADSNETGPDTDDASIPVAQNPSLNITKDASVPGNTADVAGEVISYTIGVQNTGNQTLTGVTVSDPFISNLTRVADTTGDNDNLLEVGETWAYTASHTVTQAEIDSGNNIVNVATADSNETGPDTDDASIPVAQNPSLNITKDASVPGNTADVAGEVISYTIGVQNTGNQTLTGVTVSDPFISNLTRIADTTGDNDNLLEVGETWAYTASHTVTQAEIDSGNNIVNVATADSNETGPDTDDASIPVAQNPSLNITKDATVPGGSADVAGEVISYTIGVQNTGTQTLTGVTVSDPFISNLTRIADTTGDNDNLLEVGETWAYTASHTVTQAEIDSGNNIVNVATADSNETGPDTDDASIPVAQNPSLNITKDASVPGNTADVAGEVISYTIGVQNTGNQTLTGVTVSDPFISNLTRIADTTGDNDNLLEVGETWAYTASHTVTQAEIDSGNNIVNVATADSNETGPDTDDASIPVAQNPSLNITKDASVPGNTADVAGEVISYTIGVQNTGNQTLTGVTVSDPFISNLTRIADTTGDNDNLLEVGETWAYTASHTVTQAEIDAGVPIVNTATADSNETGPDTDDASIPVAQNPSLNITKDASVPGNTADVAGEVISYTIGVQNTGNQTLTGVTVSDPFISNLTRIADTTGDNDNLLEVGETWAYTASHTVTQAEIDSGNNIVNVATADSNETGPDTDDASIPVAQNPSLNITKDATVPGGSADVAGEVISYTIGVQNTGNQTLTGVTVSDPFISNLTRVADTTGDNDNLLEVGETWAYTASHTVTQAEIDSGNNIVNVATADSNETGPDTDDASVPVKQAPSLNIAKDATVPGGSADVAGEVISYTIAVQNTGTQTLTGVTVSDPFISNLTRIADTTGDNDNLLEVGETWAYTASHTVTQAEIDAGVPIVNTATADSNETGPDTDDASIPVAQNPSLNITKDASVPGNTADVAGEVISYTIGVQNTGNQTLTGVTVSDPFISNLTRIADTTGDNDNLLEVGETWAYTASHTVTQAEIDSGNNIVNVATADSNETGPDTDDASVPVKQAPSLNIAKDATVPGGSADVAGEVISYTIAVQNTGTQTLTGVTVSDPFISNLTRIADTTGDNDNLLEVGETWAYTASHTVTQAEIDSGNNIVNVATADSNETGPDTDDASIPVAQNPSLNITKDASVPGNTADVAGEVISYTIGVQNTGNQTLTGVTVSDPFISNLTRIADTTGDNDNLLEVGETWAYTASHTVTQAEIDSGNNIVNVATADSNETGPDTDDASVPVKQAPSLNIAKDATVPGGSADVAGEVISYTIAVQNTGTQTLTGVTVSDPFISNLTRIADTTGDNDNLLEVGETWAYTASHTVTQAEIDSGNVPIVNTLPRPTPTRPVRTPMTRRFRWFRTRRSTSPRTPAFLATRLTWQAK